MAIEYRNRSKTPTTRVCYTTRVSSISASLKFPKYFKISNRIYQVLWHISYCSRLKYTYYAQIPAKDRSL